MDRACSTLHVGLTAILVMLALDLELRGGLLAGDTAFRNMELLASQRVWAVAFATAANFGILGLVSSAASFRLVSALVVATAHGIFAGCLILSDASIWSGTYTVIAIMGYAVAFQKVRSAF